MNAFLSEFDNWYGLIIAAGITLGVVGAYFAAKHRGIEGDAIIDMILICLPLAIIGARAYHVIFDALDPNGHEWTFAKFCGFDDGGDFVGLSGLAIYGGLIGSIVGAVIFHFVKNRKSLPENKRINFWQIADVGFAFIMLGQVVARWGNFTNGEAYGEIISDPAWQWAPFGMYVDGAWRYSMWLYESIWNLAGFGVLLYLYLGRHKSFDGFVFAGYCIIYGIGRAWLESIRVNDVLMLGGVRVSVLVSIFFIIAGVAIIVVHIVRAKKAGKKTFIFVDRKKLDDSYFEYEKTKLAHPMPDIVFFKDRHKKKKPTEEIVIDSSGVAIRVDAETDGEETSLKEKPVVRKAAPKAEIEEPEYEDRWDD